MHSLYFNTIDGVHVYFDSYSLKKDFVVSLLYVNWLDSNRRIKNDCNEKQKVRLEQKVRWNFNKTRSKREKHGKLIFFYYEKRSAQFVRVKSKVKCWIIPFNWSRQRLVNMFMTWHVAPWKQRLNCSGKGESLWITIYIFYDSYYLFITHNLPKTQTIYVRNLRN